jgi:ribosomal protein L40E
MSRRVALVEAGVDNSICLICRARLMATASDCGLWMCTTWLRGGTSQPVNSCTLWISCSGPTQGRRACKRSWYSVTVPVRRQSASSNNGAEWSGGP